MCLLCRFFLCLLIAYITHVVSVSQFRAISAICRTLVLANTAAFLIVLMAFLFGGVVIPKSEGPLRPSYSPLSSLPLPHPHMRNALHHTKLDDTSQTLAYLAPQWKYVAELFTWVSTDVTGA